MSLLAGSTTVGGELALGARLKGDSVLALQHNTVTTRAGLGRKGPLVLLRRHFVVRELSAGYERNFWWKLFRDYGQIFSPLATTDLESEKIPGGKHAAKRETRMPG